MYLLGVSLYRAEKRESTATIEILHTFMLRRYHSGLFFYTNIHKMTYLQWLKPWRHVVSDFLVSVSPGRSRSVLQGSTPSFECNHTFWSSHKILESPISSCSDIPLYSAFPLSPVTTLSTKHLHSGHIDLSSSPETFPYTSQSLLPFLNQILFMFTLPIIKLKYFT